MLQLTYQEQDKGDADFFLAEAKLTSVGGAVMYATGSGKASVCPGADGRAPAPCRPSLCCVSLHLTAATGSTM